MDSWPSFQVEVQNQAEWVSRRLGNANIPADTFGSKVAAYVARVAKEDLVEGAKTKARNKLGKFLDKMFSSRGMTLRIQGGQSTSLDTRMLIAAMTLLQVHDITGAASSG